MLFEQLDTFIAFAIVMLLLSVLVMAFVQLVVAVLGLRGRNLRWGVERLLQEAAPDAFGKDGTLDAHKIAHEVLTHPALGPARNWIAMLLRWVLEKTRLLKALGEPAAGRGLVRRVLYGILGRLGVLGNGRRPVCTIREQQVVQLLERVGAAPGTAVNPDTDSFVDEGVRLAEQLEEEFPAEAAALREQIQAVRKKGGVLASRVEEWFETVEDATSERFKLWTRWLTAAGALLLAFGFQVDSVSIFKQLSGDQRLRDAIVDQAAAAKGLFEDLKQAAVEEEAASAGGGAGATGQEDAAGGSGDNARQRVEEARKGLEKARELVEATGLDLLQPLYPTWSALWSDFSKLAPLGQPPAALFEKLRLGLTGKLMTVLLLSLGAPFWYGALSKLAGLRSVVAEKLEEEEGGNG